PDVRADLSHVPNVLRAVADPSELSHRIELLGGPWGVASADPVRVLGVGDVLGRREGVWIYSFLDVCRERGRTFCPDDRMGGEYCVFVQSIRVGQRQLVPVYYSGRGHERDDKAKRDGIERNGRGSLLGLFSGLTLYGRRSLA